MKNKNKPATDKNLDLLISKISVKDIMGINEMICTRGGDGREILPPPPPPNPPTTDSTSTMLVITKL